MIPKVGQLLRWYETEIRDLVGHANDDIGIVKAVEFDVRDLDLEEYTVIVDWCKGPHHSYHDQQEWEDSIRTNEIVAIE